jgi:Kef-type K+ transport system membrane component KefB
LALGAILLLGLAADHLGQRTPLPRVTLLLIFGALLGGEGLDVLPTVLTDRFDLIASLALLMIGFLLGGKLTGESLRQSGAEIWWISLSAVLGSTLLVALGLVLIGAPVEVAVILGCIAAATAPAATVDVVLESGSKGPFAKLLLLVVALDDAWGLILFSIAVAFVAVMTKGGGAASPLLTGVREVGGALVLGALIGLPAAYLTGRIRPGQPILTEALGLVFICGALAIQFEVSFLIAAMVMGAVIANLAKHHEYPFHAIEGIEWPLMVIFFVLAGASLDLNAVRDAGLIGATYAICRIIGKLTGAYIGARASHADPGTRRWIGPALLPQAGAAIGMALVASNQLPEYRQLLLSVVLSTTVFFELVGPLFTRLAIRSTGEHSSGTGR